MLLLLLPCYPSLLLSLLAANCCIESRPQAISASRPSSLATVCTPCPVLLLCVLPYPACPACPDCPVPPSACILAHAPVFPPSASSAAGAAGAANSLRPVDAATATACSAGTTCQRRPSCTDPVQSIGRAVSRESGHFASDYSAGRALLACPPLPLSCGLPAVERCRESCSITDENDFLLHTHHRLPALAIVSQSSRLLVEEV